jgi:hypothetical protein
MPLYLATGNLLLEIHVYPQTPSLWHPSRAVDYMHKASGSVRRDNTIFHLPIRQGKRGTEDWENA